MLEHYHKKLGVTCPGPLESHLVHHKTSLATLTNYLTKATPCPASAPVPGGEGGEEMEVWATILALFGWVPWRQCGVRREATTDQGWWVTCGMCGRRIRVGNIIRQRTSSDGQPLAKMRRTEAGGREEGGGGGDDYTIIMFNPKTEHRYYCPWVSKGLPSAKKPASGVEGWRYCTDVIMRLANPRQGEEEGQQEVEQAHHKSFTDVFRQCLSAIQSLH